MSPQETSPPVPQETPRAAAAFSDYLALGPSRSLRALHAVYCRQSAHKAPTRRLETLAEWSVRYRWQERLSGAITAKTEEALAKAAEIDAQSFLRTSELLADRLTLATPLHTDMLVQIRAAVRKPEPKAAGATNVNVNLAVTLRAIAERVAAEQGLDVDEVLAEAERIIEDGA